MEGEFSFAQEVLKEAIAAIFAALVLLIGAWATFFRTLRENSRKQVAEFRSAMEKQREERREKYVTETLVNAYRSLESLYHRENPLVLGNRELEGYRLRAEEAFRDVQLLGDRDSAAIAQRIGADTRLLQDGETMQSLFVSMRRSLRERLDLNQVELPPTVVRFLDDDKVLAASDAQLSQFNLLGYKQQLQQQASMAEAVSRAR